MRVANSISNWPRPDQVITVVEWDCLSRKFVAFSSANHDASSDICCSNVLRSEAEVVSEELGLFVQGNCSFVFSFGGIYLYVNKRLS